MVNWSLFSSPRARLCFAAAGLLVLAGCRTPNPVVVDASFTTSPDYTSRSPAVLATLPIEDGTNGGDIARHLSFLRHEINRQLPDRRYSPVSESWSDASLRGAAAPAGESILVPARLAELAKSSSEDAVLAVRVAEWDEHALMTNRRVRFRFEAAMVANDGAALWSGSIQGTVKAGGAGPAPIGRDASARSCIELAVRELMMRLPERVVR